MARCQVGLKKDGMGLILVIFVEPPSEFWFGKQRSGVDKLRCTRLMGYAEFDSVAELNWTVLEW